MSNFGGKLFGGRQFAGQLFGARRQAQQPPRGPDEGYSGAPLRDPRRYTVFTDDELIELGVAIILSGALDG